ncbi:hypothetical protein [Alteromonas sp. 5E99-2]|uniref:hypothetical protein n=1 Tax=Alteromonas sp. 5E99-2 TaxID=2817683 RepID=UPI001A98DC09|nr:hypothetical protein [Alteromonas sp. 5E99-2]
MKKVDACHEPIIANPITDSADALVIQTKKGKVEVSKSQFLQFSVPSLLSHGIEIIGNQSEPFIGSDFSFNYTNTYSKDSHLFVDIAQTYILKNPNGDHLHLFAHLSICIESGDVTLSCTIRNPKASQHENGKWDLGDIASTYLKALHWHAELTDAEPVADVTLIDKAHRITAVKNCTVHQASSGERNWAAPIHVNKNNKVDLPFKGYQVIVEDDLILAGQHAEPTLSFGSKENGKTLVIKDFWQNFPSSLSKQNNAIYVSLLGALQSPETELQPGEQKTREWSITHSSNVTAAEIEVSLHPDYIANTGAVFSHLDSKYHNVFDDLIHQGLDGNSNFLSKRVKSDSYGWRHFGELYADHETALTPDDSFFVSHYNNQYDPIYGMLLQWFKTSDKRWFDLADQLAKHVCDIDIYHTNLDKPEYNGGLFWHTDHYVQAYTATHRTYSKLQPSDVYEDHAGGGGPGGQHCYTQGLTLHYLLTGYTPSYQASLKLSKWIETLYEGDNTFVALALSIKNRHRADLKQLTSGQYPLDRGTGNYIQAMLDRYELTGKQSLLFKVQHIICSTISNEDNIADRDFSNVENTWFYTVFLQAVCRYLYISSNEKNLYEINRHILSSLLHYGAWMIGNEYLYLDKPDILEFPNQTWTAQDLRKLCILQFILPFLADTSKIEQQITEFTQVILKRLEGDDESETTRVLCLLMQNSDFKHYKKAGKTVCKALSGQDLKETVHTKIVKHGVVSQVKQTMSSFSFEKERQSAVLRFPQLRKWLGEPK